MNAAEKIAMFLNEDEQNWYDNQGRHLDDLAETFCGLQNWDYYSGCYRWNFPDGSALVVGTDIWDFPMSTDKQCYCFKSLPYHRDGCPLRKSALD